MNRSLIAEWIVNSILEQYPQNLPFPVQPSPDASFLLSIADMFNGKEDDTSERVREIVSDCIEKKYHAEKGDS